ncbi:MAG: M48 family metalloprotease [Bryobacterales bacterium]|nr:M48 family metalloprotease [Bryobacterales bacterium]
MSATIRALATVLLIPCQFPLIAQLEPASAHVSLYFPQIADGGNFAQRWQTRFEFTNPHVQLPAAVVVDFMAGNGSRLMLNFGSGPASRLSFTLPPRGSRSFATTGLAANTVVGWAYGSASLPVQATAIFRSIEQGAPKVDITAPPVLPGHSYLSIANEDLGVALGNPYTDAPVAVTLSAIDSSGTKVGQGSVQLPPAGHRSATLRTLIPALPPGFKGTVSMETSAEPGGRDYFVAWTLNASDGVLSSLPIGTSAWPISHHDRIRLTYWKVLNAAQQTVGGSLGLNLFSPLVELRIDPAREINAFAFGGSYIQINLALSQLISDSPSELGFVVGHEIGHIIRARLGNRPFFNSNPELDADAYGMLFNLVAGYDPYAGAGALAKLTMAAGTSGLLSQTLIDHFDVHRSDNTRISEMYNLLREICKPSQFSAFCAEYKDLIHPNFPSGVPMAEPQRPSVFLTPQVGETFRRPMLR